MYPTTLCDNRAELAGHPSTCALDVIIIPIPSFILSIYLILVFLLIAFKFSSSSTRTRNLHPNLRTPHPIFPKWLYGLYVVLLIATFGMRVLEIVRLALADMGVGLLPVGLVALALAAPVYVVYGRRRGVVFSVAFVLYWATHTGFSAVKTARLHKLETKFPAKDTKYPTSDWFLDNVVLVILYGIFSVIEFIQLLLASQQASSSSDLDIEDTPDAHNGNTYNSYNSGNGRNGRHKTPIRASEHDDKNVSLIENAQM